MQNVFAQPGLTGIALAARCPIRAGSLLGRPDALLTSSGRAAIALALESAGIGPGDRVLIPSYHCPTVRGPIEWRGAQAVPYPITATLDPDIQGIEQRLDDRTRAVLIIHYFGFPARTAAVRSLCNRRRLLLLEDCAHTVTGYSDAGSVGTVGDYAVASLPKILPVFDGGLLVGPGLEQIRTQLQSPRLMYELKAAYRVLARSPKGAWSMLAGGLSALSSMRRRFSVDIPAFQTPAAAEGGFAFEDAFVHRRAAWLTRFLTHWTELASAAERRRRNYRELAERCAGIGGLEIPFRDVPESVAPYVFAFVVEHAAEVAQRVRAAGFPVFRWEESDAGDDPIGARYAESLLQLVCHQSMESADIERLTQSLEAAVREVGRNSPQRVVP